MTERGRNESRIYCVAPLVWRSATSPATKRPPPLPVTTFTAAATTETLGRASDHHGQGNSGGDGQDTGAPTFPTSSTPAPNRLIALPSNTVQYSWGPLVRRTVTLGS